MSPFLSPADQLQKRLNAFFFATANSNVLLFTVVCSTLQQFFFFVYFFILQRTTLPCFLFFLRTIFLSLSSSHRNRIFPSGPFFFLSPPHFPFFSIAFSTRRRPMIVSLHSLPNRELHLHYTDSLAQYFLARLASVIGGYCGISVTKG